MPKRYNTPHRSRVVKTRLSEDEYADQTQDEGCNKHGSIPPLDSALWAHRLSISFLWLGVCCM